MKVIGNGVEVEHFGRAIDPGLVPRPMRTLKRPRVGYAGAIAEWFDFDLVADVARAYPDIPIVLAGPVAPPVRNARSWPAINAERDVHRSGAL